MFLSELVDLEVLNIYFLLPIVRFPWLWQFVIQFCLEFET